VVYEEDNVPQGTGNVVAHGYMNADEAEYNDGQPQVFTGIDAEEIKADETEYDHDGPLAVHDIQDFETKIDDCEAG